MTCDRCETSPEPALYTVVTFWSEFPEEEAYYASCTCGWDYQALYSLEADDHQRSHDDEDA